MAEDGPETTRLIKKHAFDFDQNNPDAQTAVNKLFYPDFEFKWDNQKPFEFHGEVFRFRGMVFSRSVLSADGLKLSRIDFPVDVPRGDFVVVFVCKTHTFQLTVNGVASTVFPGQLVALDMLQAFEVHAASIDVLLFGLSRSLLQTLFPAVAEVHGRVFSEGPHKALLLNYMCTMEEVAACIGTNDSVHVAESVVRLVANCLLHGSTGKSTGYASNIKLNLSELKRAIDAQIENPRLGAELLMAQFHVSRATIYRMFEPHGGVAKYIKGRRLDFAFSELSKYSEKKQNISMLAYRLGFSHPSVFTRAFFLRFGVNPTEVREKSSVRKAP